MRKSSSKKVEGPTRAQITARDHSGLSTHSLNCLISTKAAELRNLTLESEGCTAIVKNNAQRITSLKTDIAALEGVVERRR